MTDEKAVVLSHEGAVSTLTINRPKTLNALSPDVLDELGNAVQSLSEREETRCAIITGAGEKAFVAGADIAAMQGMSMEQARVFAALGHRVFRQLELLNVPVIAAVNGFALGGGCELALACDFIYASDKARFGQPEVNLGVIPGFGGTQRLPRRIGIARARELVYTGNMVDAQQALAMGLVNAVFAPDELMPAALKTAQLIATKGPAAINHAKEVIGNGMDTSLDEGNRLEMDAFAACFTTKDQSEGMAAFLEKRKPNFTGK